MPVVVLHYAGVAYAVVGGGCADTAFGFLHYDCEDEAVVDAGFEADLLDGVVDGLYFGGVVVGNVELGAGDAHQGFVLVEPFWKDLVNRKDFVVVSVEYRSESKRRRRHSREMDFVVGESITYMSSKLTHSDFEGKWLPSPTYCV